MCALEPSPDGCAAPGVGEDTDGKGPLQRKEPDSRDTDPGVGAIEVQPIVALSRAEPAMRIQTDVHEFPIY